MRQPTAKQLKKQLDDKVNAAFKVVCDRVQLDIFDIGKVMDVSRKAILEGCDDATVLERTRAFVQTVRKN